MLFKTLGLILTLSSWGFLAVAELAPEPVFYVHNGGARTAYIYKPAGAGPFPVMVYAQATAKPSVDTGDAVPFPALAHFYVGRGWVLLLPGRPILSDPADGGSKPQTENEKFMAAIGLHNDNIAAAINALKSQSFADVNRVFVSGHSTGGINALLLAERNLPVRGFISFSPGSKMWSENELLRNALTRAVQKSKVPIFLIQPQNDFDLGPIIFLGGELSKKGSPSRSKVFDVPVRTQGEANSFAFNLPDIWGKDVFNFINDVLKMESTSAASEPLKK